MKPHPKLSPAELRSAAESRLKERPAGDLPKNEADLRRLQHNLEVHKIELEIQNEELRAAQDETAVALESYSDLYDFAPIGYFNLALDGTIKLVNLTGASLLGIERKGLESRRFGSFVAESDRMVFSDFLKRVVETKAKQGCELVMANENDRPALTVRLEATLSGNEQECCTVMTDITELKCLENELAATNRKLIEMSRQAGMAEVATGILHNLGNVLNSVNVSTDCIADYLSKSKVLSLPKVVALLQAHEKNLEDFLVNDPKGKQIPVYIATLSDHLIRERTHVQNELALVRKHVEHIREIVVMQQEHANVTAHTELVNLKDLVEYALQMSEDPGIKHHIQVIKEMQEVPPLVLEKHKVLQILVNLLRNAKQACNEAATPNKQITLRVINGGDCVRISICNNGVGIAPENLIRIFTHGFTTRKDGHGFGLHISANSAKEMKGVLTVESTGVDQGATFTLELPLRSQAENSKNRKIPSL